MTALFQDSRGFLWIGTQGGLQRYDGRRFKTYLANARDTAALQSDWISSIFEDSKKRLWIGTDHGACYQLIRRRNTFHNFNLKAGSSNKINGVWNIAEDKEGHIWLAGHNGYFKFNEEKQLFENQDEAFGLTPEIKTGNIFIDDDNCLWLCTTEGLKYFDQKKKQLYSRKNNPNKIALLEIEKSAGFVYKKDKELWAIFSTEIYRYNFSSGKMDVFTFPLLSDNSRKQQKEFLSKVLLLRNGTVQIPMSTGLAILRPGADSFNIIRSDNEGNYAYHADQEIPCIMEDSDHDIFIGNGMGINIVNPQKILFQTHNFNALPKNNFPHGQVNDLLELPGDKIMAALYGRGGGMVLMNRDFDYLKQYQSENKLKSASQENDIWSLFSDEKGTIWGPNQQHTILKADWQKGKTAIDSSLKKWGQIVIIKSAGEDLWIGTWRNGLLKKSGRTGAISAYDEFLNANPNSLKQVTFL